MSHQWQIQQLVIQVIFPDSYIFETYNCPLVDIAKPTPLGSAENNFAILDGIKPGIDYIFEISTINCLGEGSAFPATHNFNY